MPTTDLRPFFNPKSVVLIGASERPGSIGGMLAKHLLEGKFEGNLYFTNIKRETIFNHKCYPNLETLPEDPELAVLAIPANFIPAELQKCAERNIHHAIVLSGGFSEVGNIELEEELIRVAKENDIRIIGPNCAGIASTHTKMIAAMENTYIPGGLSIISQSGALAGSMMLRATYEGLGIDKWISFGNACDVEESELLKYLAEEKNSPTKVIFLYLEGATNGRKLIEELKIATKLKPVIFLKGGRSAIGNKAAMTHTASLGGDPKIYESVAKQTGALWVESLDEAFDTYAALAPYLNRGGKRIAIVTNSGGPGVLTSDNLDFLGMELNQPSEKLREKLKELPTACPRENPFDLLGDATPERYELTLRALAHSGEFDTIITIMVPPGDADVDGVAKVMVKIAKEDHKTAIIGCLLAGKKVENAIKILRENDIPSFPTPKRAAWGAHALNLWKKSKE
ncbi:MAG TPA: CoA-binding protein [candidate division Zixibacteria bacterium]|nr:CoA-binding protein [candidate division Zixibacteria bacterium]